MRNEMEFLEDEITRKLSELNASEKQRVVDMAVADHKLNSLTKDIDLLNKRVIEILTVKDYR